MKHESDKYQDIRDAVRGLCAEFPDEYHRKVDAERAYPEAESFRAFKRAIDPDVLLQNRFFETYLRA